MPYQDNFNTYMAYKVQTALGSPASGSGASILPLTGGVGNMERTPVNSAVVRRDGMQQRGRHGMARTSGNYPGELSLTNQQPIFEAIMQGTFTTGSAITQTNMSSATMSVSGSTITFSAGSLITAGVRVGDTAFFTIGLNAADLGKPLMVVGLTATGMTVHRTLTTVAGPVSAYSFSVKGKKLINPAAGALVKRYFTIEERELGLSGSKLFQDCVWSQMELGFQPNGMFTANPSWIGTGAMSQVTPANFTSPSDPTAGLNLAAIDVSLRLNGSDVLDMTSFSLTLSNGATAPDVVANVAPDVFIGPFQVSGSISLLKKDYSLLTAALNETQIALHVMAQVPNSSPQDFVSFYIGNLSITPPTDSEISRQAGARTQTVNFAQELVGIDDRGGAYDPTMFKCQFSA